MPMAMQLIAAIVATTVVLFSVDRALQILALCFRVAVVAPQIVTEILGECVCFSRNIQIVASVIKQWRHDRYRGFTWRFLASP